MKKLWIAALGVAIVVGFAAVPAGAATIQLQGTWTGTVTLEGPAGCPTSGTITGTLDEPYLGHADFQIAFAICGNAGGAFVLTAADGSTITPQGSSPPQAAIFHFEGGRLEAIAGAPCTLPLRGTGRFADIVGSGYFFDPNVPPNPVYGYCIPGSYIVFDFTDAITGGPQPTSGAVTGAILTSPATKEACKKGGWQQLFDTSARPFKNQGDCVSFVATGGKHSAAP